jgi:hypothetical protein
MMEYDLQAAVPDQARIEKVDVKQALRTAHKLR